MTRIAIVDYGLGNLFSVKRACEHVGGQAVITSDQDEILSSDVVILPGVGAFGDAMNSLREKNLVEPLREYSHSGKTLVGICLGMQLLMEESFEFGHYEGLGLISGKVIRFENPQESTRILKVPEVGWNRLCKVARPLDPWLGTPLENLPDGAYMYFVHSYHVMPKDPDVVLSTTRYGHIEFASSVRIRNTYGFQHHPERSGREGLLIYESMIRCTRSGASLADPSCSTHAIENLKSGAAPTARTRMVRGSQRESGSGQNQRGQAFR